MGRELGELWYSSVDVSEVSVLVVEWTHGNSDHLVGVDVPILLNSTPEETLTHRRARARDGATDSPFTTMVLALEQAKLASQAHKAKIIVAKSGQIIDYDAYLESMGRNLPGAGAMLNVYPDSVGGTVSDVVDLVTDPAVTGAFSAVYLLPSVFNTDLDRGFSVIDYGLNRMYATQADLDALRDAGISLKLDFILNHASVLSPQFQDLVAKGDRSANKDFMTYDFFLPGLVIDALARRDASVLTRWIREVVAKQIRTVTMLGCHDGIPLLDLKGLLDDEHIEAVIETVKGRGGYVKDLHGAKNIYYQVNATYY